MGADGVGHHNHVDEGVSPHEGEHRGILTHSVLLALVLEHVQMRQEKQASH